MKSSRTPPETRYAKSGDIHIAYQIIGGGPLDLVFVPGFISHVEWFWEEPTCAGFFARLASFARLILFDKRGTGLSDRVAHVPTLEQRMDDVRAVLDAAGSERAAILGVSEGGPMSVLFAATYPERTAALVLYGTFAEFSSWVATPQDLEHILAYMDASWGTGASLPRFAPSVADDERFQHWWARHERLGASPGAAMALMRMNSEIDVRPVLPVVHVPTLVLHRRDDVNITVIAGRHIAQQIPGAKYIELAGRDHVPWIGDADAMLNEIQEFLTGVRHVPEPDRVLATVLFIDVVGSTERAAALGDRRWRDQLESYYHSVRQELGRFKGREISTVGDGVLATFDGPARAIRCACAIRDAVHQLGLEIRAGLHTGECEVLAGGADVGGIAVHIGARVAAIAAPGEVLVSSTVKDLVAGSGLQFQDRGARTLKGVPSKWRLFAVEHNRPPA
ncbi:adenylate/guanylate cyclase domain-containing protein [Microvirga calopogonii]|uniref:adenylate/guanylate cyclase domain-containing protein n=1 Tax=Microvirga calopogonii TaxID=2078013 RepID=UPI000E0CFC38|nr:adenylate/guanylate cyclase domain-containing protein [Microvirga calopogonii]